MRTFVFSIFFVGLVLSFPAGARNGRGNPASPVVRSLGPAAATSPLLQEAEQLGSIGGMAMACSATEDLERYETFAARILSNKSATEKEELRAFKAYAMGKANAYRLQTDAPGISCTEVISRFVSQPIFQARIDEEGTVSFPDGREIKPARAPE